MKNVILKGDCLEIMPYLPDNSVGMVLCDLPYGTTRCKWDTPIDLAELWANYANIVKPNGAIVLFAQTPFDKVLGVSNLKDLKYEWIWEKTNATGHLNSNRMPMKAHENILVFYKKQPVYNPQKTTGHKPMNNYTKKHNNDGDVYGSTVSVSGGGSTERHPRTVQTFKSDTQKIKLNSTQKPVDLLRMLIRTYTNPGDTVMDNTSGSASTGVAAVIEDRNYILIEKDTKEYVQGLHRMYI